MKERPATRLILVLLFTIVAVPSSGRADPAPVMTGPEGRYAFEMLGRYYETGEEPPYYGALEMLVQGSPAEQDTAGKYLLALFAQSLADETNGRGPKYPTPFFGGELDYPAHDFRQTLSNDFASDALGPGALPVCVWLLEKETDPEIASMAMPVLMRGEPPPELLERILDEPHPNFAVLALAIEMYAGVASREEVQKHLEPLVHHLVPEVREAAVARFEALSIPVLAFDPERALTLPVRAALNSVRVRIFPSIPPGSSWVRFRPVSQHPDSLEGRWLRETGWIVSETDSIWWVVDEYGSYRQIPRSSFHLEPSSLSATADFLAEVPKYGDEDLAESTGGYVDFHLDLACVVVASWCLEQGDTRSACRLLSRALHSHLTLKPFLEHPEERLRYLQGEMLLRLMYYAPRDTLLPQLLEHLVRSYSRSSFDETHRELLAQFLNADPRLTGSLPDSVEWEGIRASMSREDLIAYLMNSLPLENAFSSCDAKVPRWPESRLDAAGPPVNTTVADLVARPVLSPPCALRDLNLTIDDIPAVAPFLEDRTWRVYARDTGRPSSPGDYTLDLQRIQQEAAEIINWVARQDLVNADSLMTLDETGRHDYTRRIAQWAAERSGKSDDAIRLEVLGTTKEQHDYYLTMEHLARRKNGAAVPIILRRFDDFPQVQDSMLESLADLDAVEALPLARKILENPKQWSRKFDTFMVSNHKHDTLVSAALRIVLSHGDRQAHEGLAEAETFLRGQIYPLFRAIPLSGAMLASDSARSQDFLCGLFDKPHPDFDVSDNSDFCRAMIERRCTKTVDLLLRVLDAADSMTVHDPKHAYNSQSKAMDVARVIRKWVPGRIQFEGPDFIQPRAWQDARLWLEETKDRIVAGEGGQ